MKAFQQPGALKGAFNDYRAGAGDVAQDEADKDSKIACPVLVLWGEDFAVGGKLWDFREVWHEYATETEYATQSEFVSVPQCGHLPHEERPEVVNEALLQFLRR